MLTRTRDESPVQQPSMKDDSKQPTVTHQNPVKTFEGHENDILAIVPFPDGQRMATSSADKTIRIWGLRDGKEMKKWVTKRLAGTLAISKDGKKVVIPEDWELSVRNAESGRVVAALSNGHKETVVSLDISSDGGIMASGSYDRSVILWDTTTWQRKCDTLSCGGPVNSVQFSVTGRLGVATDDHLQIWDMNQLVAQFNGHADFNHAWNLSLTWTRDGNLLSAGSKSDPVIRCWDTSTRKQIGDPWTGHDGDKAITGNCMILNHEGTLLASASGDHTIRLWRLSTSTEVMRYKHSNRVNSAAFSMNGRFIFGGGRGQKISQWEISEDVLAAACDASDSLGRTDAGPSREKQTNTKSHLDMEVPNRQRRNMANDYLGMPGSRAVHAVNGSADADNPSSPRVTFFNRISRLSNKEGKKKQKQTQRRDASEVVDVPLGQATYGDYVASKEDGIRPHSLFFCLGWFRKKEKKPDPPPQLYDVDIMHAAEEDILNVPVPTPRVWPVKQETIELTLMASQSQQQAGPSCLPTCEKHSTMQPS